MRKTKKRSKTRIIILIALALLVILSLWWLHGSSPANSNDTSSQIFVVKPGEPLREIINQLDQHHLIADPTVYFLTVKLTGKDQKIQAGSFKLSPSMNPSQITDALTKGTEDIWVHIIEGQRATEIDATLKEIFPNYDTNWDQQLVNNEGFLFPDTYRFAKSSSIDQIIATLRKTFDEKFNSVPTNPDNPYTQKQIVTVASLVEREAKFPEDRPLVASVIYNRLNIGMPLQIDATIQYALGYQTTTHSWWKKELSSDDLKISSPYNTYTNVGLPPTPIANPGLDSLAAAIKPAQTSYLYYISDATGHNHYASTLEEHNANIQKYGI